MTAPANPDARPGSAVGRVILASRLAWPLCAWAVGGAIGVIALDVLDRVRVHSLDDAQPAGIVLPVSFSLLGAMIVSRQPGNRIGWIYLLIGVVMPLQPLGALYYERSVLSGGLPGARWAAWLNTWTVQLVFPAGLSLFAFLLFPSGHLPSERWRPFAWLAVVTSVFGVALVAIDPTPISVVSRPTEGRESLRDHRSRLALATDRRQHLVVRDDGAARPRRRQPGLAGSIGRPGGAPAVEASGLCRDADDRLSARGDAHTRRRPVDRKQLVGRCDRARVWSRSPSRVRVRDFQARALRDRPADQPHDRISDCHRPAGRSLRRDRGGDDEVRRSPPRSASRPPRSLRLRCSIRCDCACSA